MKIALVTGAGRGLGQGIVQALSSKGYFVYAGIHNPDAKTQDTELVRHLQLDVENDASIQRALGQIKSEQGRLDLLVNNAGIRHKSGETPEKTTVLSSLDRTSLQAVFSVNATSPLMVIKHAAPLMTEPNCFIINISSDRSSFANTGNKTAGYAYRASKVALNMLTLCCVFDLPENISIFAVHPGWVRTDMNPAGVLEPVQSATLILAIIEHWKPEQNGRFLNNDGTLHQV